MTGGVSAAPDRIVLVGPERRWTRRELAGAAARGATDLVGRGATAGATVATLLRPSPAAVVAVHAVLRTGALLAPLNTRLTPAEIGAALSVLDPDLVVAGPDGRALAREAAERVGVELREADPLPWLDGGEGASGETLGVGVGPPGGAAGPTAVLWTSGTTGRPRGVLLTAAALRHSAEASGKRLRLGADDRWYASLDPAHVGGLALVTRAAHLGSTLVATGAFDAAELSRRIDDGSVTHASLVPTMLARLLEERGDRPAPATLRCLLVGGAACPAPLLDRALAAGMPVALTYGMTETTSQVATAPPDLVRRKPGTVGAPLSGVEVRIDGGGEILVRGPVLAAGLVGGEDELVGSDGWLRTGDLGEMDDEGHLRVTGRRSERIVSGGVNVDPSEVEAVLLGHPAVREAAVVGLPDPEWGERVVAAVVAGEGSVEEGALRAWARERLAGAKAPKRVAVLAALPRNANGKVDRPALRELLGSVLPPA